MKKRINPVWRIVIALLLLFALAPVVALSIPAQAGAPPDTYINDIPEYLGPNIHPGVIAGTAIADSPSTVNQVKVQITYEATGKTYYWTGAAWTTIETTLIAPFVIGFPSLWTPQYDWSVALPSVVDLADGTEYTVTAWSEDTPGMVQDPTPAGRSFTWDDELPGASVIQTIGDAAAPGWTASTITAISGTATDANSGVACVYVRIQRLTDGMYWDGVTWQPVPIYIMATGTTSWSVTTTTTPPLPNWTHGAGYNVEVYAVDNAGNSETVPATQAFSFAKVLTVLDGYIDTIPDYVHTTALPFITGTAHAGQGNVERVDVKIQRQEDLYYWSDLSAAWVTSLTWNLVGTGFGTPSVDWSYPAPLFNDGVEYYVWAQVTDGGATPWGSTSPTTFIADDTAPIGTQIYGSFIPGSTYLGPTVFDPMTVGGVTGSSVDMTGGSNPGMLDSVKLLIERLDTGFWWDGVAWQVPAGFYIDATGTTSWSITGATAPNLPLWEHMVYYSITAMGMDEAGNLELSAVANFVFIADLTGLAPPPTQAPTPTPTPTPSPPVLSSITWNDVDGAGNITAGDELTFVFSKEMDDSTISYSNIATRLPTSPSHSYGTLNAASLDWNTAVTELTVTLGSGETIVGAETVNPHGDVKSADGASDATTAPGPSITLPEEGLVWEWWYYLLIGLGVVIIIAAIVLLVVLPKRGAGGELLEEEDLYGEEEEEEF